MKRFRFIAPELSVDITMPGWLFPLFKKFSSVRSVRRNKNLQGRDIEIVYFDEEIPQNSERKSETK